MPGAETAAGAAPGVLVRRLAARLRRLELRIVTAESCTGGSLAGLLTELPGSSAWFERGFVTYSDASKQAMLGVPAVLLAEHGAVSEAAACAMAEGALRRSRAGLAAAITGIAGPGGGSAEKPVGTVWLAWARRGRPILARGCRFAGDRRAVRRQARQQALLGLLQVARD